MNCNRSDVQSIIKSPGKLTDRLNCRTFALLAGCLLIGVAGTQSLAAAEPPGELSFSRDIRPILADKCFHCHGADAASRQADLRLDEERSAKASRSGSIAIVPGKPELSDLMQRILSTDDSERMPPPKSERQLSEDEKGKLKRWIAEGAKYEQHWSFTTPQQPALPQVNRADWGHNPIDAFVLHKLEQAGLAPSSEADRITLIRRVSLDLTGIPPTPAEVDAFISDDSPLAYERLVDRLLGSPRYGERLALDWLDAARFADSGGYQGDIFRTMWPWRDWVIAAFNRNLPFDQFTVEQLAGDLLPNATRDQLVASGFHRNHRINDEDGIIVEEYRVEYVVDRVETTASVWLGLTMGCCRCHDHKYDPLTQVDFYRFYAFFNSIDESGRGNGNAPPTLRLTTPEQDRLAAEFDREIAPLQEKLKLLGDDPATADQKKELTAQLQAVTKKKEAVLAPAPVTMIMRELPTPRDSFVLVRGAYDKPGEKVTPALPGALPALPPGATANRLGLAQWLVDPQHPLTSRVIVNRYWQMVFGTGLVATPEDFGTQGTAPSHPELLDWLATEFVASGWDVKQLLRLMVTSATYRQSSRSSAEAFQQDPENLMLARGARYRLPAEQVRDQALAASGLLAERLGGPSVLPYQPEGLWTELASAGQKYPQSRGADLYRRSMYTFWRRTVHHPTMAAFDAPAREICAVRRARTNTPIQALAMMNEPGFIEAGRQLAERVLRETAADPDARLSLAFRLVLARSPSESELKLLRQELQFFQERYAAQPEIAAALLKVGESPVDAKLPPSELAAYAAIANTILNLDEAVTKE